MYLNQSRADLEDVVSLETCIRLEGDATDKKEPCSITIKLKDGKKIGRIAIVSEAFLIEIYKQYGEYVSTARAEFIDEFEQSAVYFADACFVPPTPELSIKVRGLLFIAENINLTDSVFKFFFSVREAEESRRSHVALRHKASALRRGTQREG